MKKFTKAITALMITLAVVCAAGCRKTDDPNNVGNSSGSFNGHDYVDLGLPSGTLWATCNVGADTPEGYGYYFAWGEITIKATYNWALYKYCNGNYDQLTKYCTDSNYGYNSFTDNLTTLQPEDDAVIANWDDGWCMPTADQWRELRDNTTTSWTSRNGVKGRLFTASNGNSLFLPSAGYCWDSELYDAGDYGYYWSSSLFSDYPYFAWRFYFNSSQYTVYYGSRRYVGQSVRAVCTAQ